MKIQNSKFKIQNLGFTLVELLIVIALIGILAGAIVATLNPVEQVNKARDAKYDNETAELLAGLERYYASLQTYPWLEMADGPGGTGAIDLESVWGGDSLMCGAGILGAADFEVVASTAKCVITENGKLIDAQEVKAAFKNKAQFDTSSEGGDLMYIYKELGAGGSVYTCFVPKSNTNRQNTTRLRCLNTGGPDDGGIPSTFVKAGEGSCVAPTTSGDPAWALGLTSGDNAIFFCVPE